MAFLLGIRNFIRSILFNIQKKSLHLLHTTFSFLPAEGLLREDIGVDSKVIRNCFGGPDYGITGKHLFFVLLSHMKRQLRCHGAAADSAILGFGWLSLFAEFRWRRAPVPYGWAACLAYVPRTVLFLLAFFG